MGTNLYFPTDLYPLQNHSKVKENALKWAKVTLKVFVPHPFKILPMLHFSLLFITLVFSTPLLNCSDKPKQPEFYKFKWDSNPDPKSRYNGDALGYEDSNALEILYKSNFRAEKARLTASYRSP